MSSRFSRAALLVLLAVPATAAAQGVISDTITTVGGPLQMAFGGGCVGANCAVSVTQFVISRLQMIVATLATLYIVRNAFTMVYSAQDDEQTKARRAIAAVATGMVLMFLAPSLLQAFYTAGGEEGVLASQGTAQAGAAILTDEIIGLLNWVQVLVAVSAVTVIIIAGLQALAGFGKDDGLNNLKATVLRVAAGIIIILLTEAIKATLGLANAAPPGSPNPLPLISRGLQMVNGGLALVTLVAVCIVVYAAIMMIVTMGNEEQFRKSRSLILSAGIGLIVILISWITITFLVGVLG